MRKYPSYSLLTAGGLLLAGSCSIIAEVDRTKIPQDGGTPEGGQGSGGTSGTGGVSGSSGTGGASGSSGTGGASGSSGTGGTAGEGGMGGEPGGMGGEDMGGAGSGGTNMGGEGGAPGPECGNGIIESGEQCDDDDLATGDGCNATCQREAGWNCTGSTLSVCTPICGDGVDVGTAEVCDDRNSLACGTCAGNASGTAGGCSTAITPTAATGSVTPTGAATLADGTTFTLNDGYHAAVTFEFDSDDSIATNTATPVAIDFTTTMTAVELQTAIIVAVNGVTTSLFITASPGTAPAVTLTHDRASSLGNQAIVRGGTGAGADVTVGGMIGGLAGNCPATTACVSDADCASLDCNTSNQCTTP